jgi:DNA-binding SARP family transcriptional activator
VSLRIYLFGSVHISRDGLTSDLRMSRTSTGLLAYLVLLRHRSHSREVLASLFWGDEPEERARACLNTTLWRLRRIIEPTGTTRGTYLVTVANGEVRFNWESDHWIDVAIFEERLHEFLAEPVTSVAATVAHNAERAIKLYTGDLMEAFFEDRIVAERERLRNLHLSGLAHLSAYYREQGDHDRSLQFANLLLQHDPLREDIHQEMMRIYLDHGEWASAARQYVRCRGALQEMLGVAPMDETEALYVQTLRGNGRYSGDRASPEEPDRVQGVLEELQAAIQALESTRDRLHRAVSDLGQRVRAQDRQLTTGDSADRAVRELRGHNREVPIDGR